MGKVSSAVLSIYSRTARFVCLTLFPDSASLPACTGATHAAKRAYAARRGRTSLTTFATLHPTTTASLSLAATAICFWAHAITSPGTQVFPAGKLAG